MYKQKPYNIKPKFMLYPLSTKYSYERNLKTSGVISTNYSSQTDQRQFLIQKNDDRINQNYCKMSLHPQKLRPKNKYNFSILRTKTKSFTEQNEKFEEQITKFNTLPDEQCVVDNTDIITGQVITGFNIQDKEKIEEEQNNESYLTQFEQKEILSYKKVYFRGLGKKIELSNFTDQNGNYISSGINDHFQYRYQILEFLGKGSNSQIFKVLDHKNEEIVAIKVIKQKRKIMNQALVEIKILNIIKNSEYISNIVQFKEYFIFRNHICLVFEYLHLSLYEAINEKQPLPEQIIHKFAIQILNALNYLYKNGIVHCDLKPENIMFKEFGKSFIKLIDFSKSSFVNQRTYSYIQTRPYRAPEVILGVPYDMAVDMWSFGCIMAEMVSGSILFNGKDDNELIFEISKLIGLPRQEFLNICPYKNLYFKDDGTMRINKNFDGKVSLHVSKTLEKFLQCKNKSLVDFIQKCLVWESTKRMKPLEALMHNWILESN